MKEILEEEDKRRLDHELRPEDLLLKCYHDFLNVATKEASDKLPPHRDHDHQIQLKAGTDPRSLKYTGLRHHSEEELAAIKQFVQKNLSKDFIRALTAS